MSTRSPSGTSSPATGSTDFSTGVLSPGERRLLDLQRRGHEQPPVRRDLVAGLEGDDVAGDDLLRRDVDPLAAAADVRVDQEHLLERGDALRGLALLVEAQDRVQHGQADDHETRGPLLERDDADDRGAEEDELHQVAVLPEERPPARLLLRLPRACSGPTSARRRSTSAASSPVRGSTPSCAHGLVRGQAVPVRVTSDLRARPLEPRRRSFVVRSDEDDLRAVRADLVAAVVLGTAGVGRQTDHEEHGQRSRSPIE